MSCAAGCGCCSPPDARPGDRCPTAASQDPGGWNRIHLIVDDLAAEVQRLRSAGSPSATTS